MENSAQGNTQDTQPDINPYFLRYLREKVAQVTQEELAGEIVSNDLMIVGRLY